PVRRVVEPAARARGVRQRDDGRPVQLEPLADAGSERGAAEQPSQREASDRDDHLWPQQLELPLAPEGAELLLARRRRAVAAAGRGAPRVAARHRRAVEGRVEVVLLELEPAAKRPAGAATPREPLFSLDHARRLAEHVRTLV